MSRNRFRRSLLVILAAPALALAGVACIEPAAGTVTTPAAPTQSAASRLPQLLSQLQGAGAGLELMDSPSSQVLGAQDQQGKFTDTGTPAATATTSATPGTTPTSLAVVNPTNTPRPGATATPVRTTAATATPTAAAGTPTPTPTAAATATTTTTATTTATATPTLTPTPRPSPPSEGTPPTE
ncbi:MAG: hypothetical protein HYX53_09015 [Chloroflexi bacterium]|nr:hypothetical protein [Chloroflexota bacterium]